MAEQLRRAPWFLISIVGHAIVLLILFLISTRTQPEQHNALIALSLDDLGESEVLEEDLEDTTEDIEIETVNEPALIEDVVETLNFDEEEADLNFDIGFTDPINPLGAAEMLEKLRAPQGESAMASLGTGAESNRFRQRISGLRKTGLDIVFVFDSTQSMDQVLDETKQRIETMVDVLHELVDNTRIGVVTYRDRGEHEEYLTREIPLCDDYYRVVNFMQTVHASGGGDFPEAVYDAIKCAAQQMSWRKGSQRVIVIIGDAPAKKAEERPLQSVVKGFARHENAQIHAIMTKRGSDGVHDRCRATFSSIAQLGHGACIPLEDEAAILQEVMSLALGREHKRSIESIYTFVDQRRQKISAKARDIVHRGDLESLRNGLFGKTLDDELIRAAARSKSARVADYFVSILRKSNTKPRVRHAMSFALQRMLGLYSPPVDPEEETPLSQDRARTIRKIIQRDLR